MIHSIYSFAFSPTEYLTASFFENMESLGCTDVTMTVNGLTYAEVKILLEAYLKNMETTKLRLTPCYAVLSYFTPSSVSTFLKYVSELISELGIVGFSTDDFVVNSNWKAAQLKTFAEDFTNTIHEANPKAKSSAPFYEGGSGVSAAALVPFFDFIIPELYRRPAENDNPPKDHTWVKNTLNKYIAEVGNANKILPAVATCDSTAGIPITPFPVADILEDVNIILGSKTAGYVYWVWDPWDHYCPVNLTFPKGG
jgi:hypothetical protein